MDERALIETYFGRRQGPRPDIVIGIGDDAAVVRPPPGFDLVVATDAVMEGTHFPAGIPPAAMGHRCLAVNLSDLAAMAAEPLWFTLALSLPRAEPAWLEGFSRGLFALAERFGIALVGGDTLRGPLGASVTVHGKVRPGRAVRRRGARPGDGIWVTGTPGDAVAGRHLLAAGPAEARSPAAAALVQRFLYPEPRVREGLSIGSLASAMIDVSDGLHDDLCKLAAASGVGADVDAGELPLSVALREVGAAEAVAHALTGGDDYELCFSVPAHKEDALRALAAGFDVPVTRIGEVVPEPGVRWRLGGVPLAVPDTTFRHF